LAWGLGITGSSIAYGQQDWPAYGGQDGTHYSSLSQINRDNVKNLVVAWKYDTGEKGGIEANPIIVGKVLYATTPRRSVGGAGCSNGKLIWKFDFGLPGFRAHPRCLLIGPDGQQSRHFSPAPAITFMRSMQIPQGDSQLWGERQNRLT